MDHFNPYSPSNFLIYMILVCKLLMGQNTLVRIIHGDDCSIRVLDPMNLLSCV